MSPSISIIIPNYNYERFLEERFLSILNQTYQDFEIVFLDDASTDQSVSLATSKFSSYIQNTEVNSVNSGSPFVQWNRGIHLIKGEFVWIAEADDTCEPNFLELMMGAMERSPKVGLAYCKTVPIDADGTILDANFHGDYLSDLDSTRWFEDFINNGDSEVRKYLSRKNTITNVSGVLFRREAFIQSGYAPENLSMCGDWMLYCRILRDWDVAYVNAPLNFHRQHPSKHTRNSVLNLVYFREFLHVQQYVCTAFSLSKSERKMAFRRFLGEWDRLTVSDYGYLNLDKNFKISLMLLKSYGGPFYCLEIFVHFIFNITKFIRATWLIR